MNKPSYKEACRMQYVFKKKLRIRFCEAYFLQMACDSNDHILSYKLNGINVAYFTIEFMQSFPGITPLNNKTIKKIPKVDIGKQKLFMFNCRLK